MSEQVWYVYQQEQQLGPYAQVQLLQLFDSNMIAQDAYLFKVGWKDWRPVEECSQEVGKTAERPHTASSLRQQRAPRASIGGRVIVHNNGQLVIGGGVNISATGIFVETPDLLFRVGETLKLTCRVDGFQRSFNATAVVVRYNGDVKLPIGYGMQFQNLDAQIARELQGLIDQENRQRAVRSSQQ